jgi:hypothetical protein
MARAHRRQNRRASAGFMSAESGVQQDSPLETQGIGSTSVLSSSDD